MGYFLLSNYIPRTNVGPAEFGRVIVMGSHVHPELYRFLMQYSFEPLATG
jgi:hypothetical protein